MALELDGNSLTVSDVIDVGRFMEPITISKSAMIAINNSHNNLNILLKSGKTIYGASVGCGELDKQKVSESNISSHQTNLVIAHACGVGPTMEYEQARAMMLCRLNIFLKGSSGVSEGVISGITRILNSGIAPSVPIYGSVGSSDLVPLAHMACSLIGRGEFINNLGMKISKQDLDKHKIKPIELTGRDGLALINGLGQTLAIASLNLFDINKLLNLSICASHLTLELITPGALRDQLNFVELKKHETLNYLTSRLTELTQSKVESKDRSPLSLRYAHSVSATLIDVLKSAKRVVVDELNAVSDNPIIGDNGAYTNNSVNTSSQRIAIALDSLSVALAAACVASERRIQQLIRKDAASNLTPYLTHPTKEPSSNYGMMIMQYTAASLTAELKTRIQSRCIQSIPVGGLFEDLNSNVNHSALNLSWIKSVFSQLVAIELLATMQGYDVSHTVVDSGFESLFKSVRKKVPALIEPRIQSHDITAIEEAIKSNTIKAPVVVNIFDALSQHYS